MAADSSTILTSEAISILRSTVDELKRQHVREVVSRLDVLERKLDELLSGRTLGLADSYRGTFQPGTEYRRGDLVTCGGSLWLAIKDSGARPGTSDAWRLTVKRGRNAKDAR